MHARALPLPAGGIYIYAYRTRYAFAPFITHLTSGLRFSVLHNHARAYLNNASGAKRSSARRSAAAITQAQLQLFIVC